MRALLDTQLLLWTALEPERLSATARATIADPANELAFSAVSIWEIAIKRALGRPSCLVDPGLLRQNLIRVGYAETALVSAHAIAVASLPPIHRDPFDRVLIAQAAVEGMTLLTADRTVAEYPGAIRRV